MPKQPLASYDQRLKGSSFARMFRNDGPENRDFLLDQGPVQGRQTLPLIYPDCVPGQNNALVYVHTRILTQERRKRYE